MSKIQLGLTEIRRLNDRAMTLSERDVRDAVRLLDLLLSSQSWGSRTHGPEREQADVTTSGVGTPSLKAKARAMLRQRRSRTHYFSPSMFSEPAWDMLLVLFAAEDSQQRFTITSLVELSEAPATTALRWLTYLEHAELIERQSAPLDRRVTFINITPFGTSQMNVYLEGLANA